MKARENSMFGCSAIIAACVIAMIFSAVSASAEDTYKLERLWPTLHQPWYFGDVEGIAVDSQGYVYVADMYSHCIRKFTSDGHLVTRWGSYGEGTGQFRGPSQVAIDHKNGWLYVVEKYGNRVQKFSLDGKYLNVSWGEKGCENGQFNSPRRIAADMEGSVYVSDSRNYRIQKFDANGVWNATWGIKGEEGGQFLSPRGISFDSQGYVYVADSKLNCVQKFTPEGKFVFKWSGSNEDEGGNFNAPNGLAIDKDDFIYVVNEEDDSVQKFDLKTDPPKFVSHKWDGESTSNSIEQRIDELIDEYLEAIQTYRMNFQALRNLAQYLPNGVENGTFKAPKDIAISPGGAVYIADTGNQRIQKLDSEGNFAAKWSNVNNSPGTFQSPLGVAVHGEFIYVADSGNNRIQKFRQNGEFVREWGGEGSASGKFRFPADIAVDREGNVYVADTLNARIQKFDSDGRYLRTWGEHAIVDGKLVTDPDKFLLPVGITFKNDEIYVADLGRNRISQFNEDGRWPPTHWEAQSPVRVAVDHLGNVYVVNQDCNCVQKFTNGKRVEGWQIILSEASEVVGTEIEYTGLTIASDPEGQEFLYVSTGESNYRIWKFKLDPNKQEAESCAHISEPGHEAGQVVFPCGIDVDEDGKVYVADTGNHRVQVFRQGQGSDEMMKAIIVAGRKYKDDDLWDKTELSANFVYRALIYQGFTKDTIYYLSPSLDLDLDGDGKAEVDADTGNRYNLKYAITDWAAQGGTHDVVLYIVDHGDTDGFRLNENEEILKASDLAEWVNTLQKNISGKIIVVYEACYSGSFMDDLKLDSDLVSQGRERIIITSASDAKRAKFFSQGSISFSSYFWNGVFNGENIGKAFRLAHDAMGGAENQAPLLDDNCTGDYVPDNGDGTYEDDEDGELAENTYIGNGMFINRNVPKIEDVFISDVIDNAADISVASVTDEDGIARVWAEIIGPDHSEEHQDEALTDMPIVDLLEKDGAYKGVYEKFDTPGDYHIFIYARDSLGNTSPPKLLTIKVDSPLTRKAIIVLGESQTESLSNAVAALGALAYETLDLQGYSGNDISILTPAGVTMDGIPPGFTFGSSPEKLRETIESLGEADTQDLVLYMIGIGGQGFFQMTSEEKLWAADETDDNLDIWLDDLQKRIPGSVTVIYDACRSGSFIPLLTPPPGKERIVITSTDEDGSAHFLFEGEVSFSKYFWNSVTDGVSTRQAFVNAERAILKAKKSSGEKQLPQINDDGNSTGNDERDGNIAINHKIGDGTIYADDDDLAGSVSSDQTLDDGGKATIWVRLTSGTASEFWAEIHSPLPEEDDFVCCITDMISRRVALHYDNREGWYEYEITSDDFHTNEMLLSISIYAKDKDGKPCLLGTTEVCLNDSDHDGMGDCWDPDPYGSNDEWLDSDHDGVPDKDDIFPFDPAEQYDSDSDGEGDNIDDDDDNDGVPDILEEFYDTSPIEPEDGSGTCNLAGHTAGKYSSQALEAMGTGSDAAEGTYSISGFVKTHNGLGIEDIRIRVENADGTLRTHVVTDRSGHYSLNVEPEWEGRLMLSGQGFVFVHEEEQYDPVTKSLHGQNFMAAPLPESNADAVPTIQTVQSGDWDDPNTWNLDRTPTEDDIVRINEGHTVEFNPSDEEFETENPEGTDNQCDSDTITAMRQGNRIKGFINFGTLKSQSDQDIMLWTKDFIYNNGIIRGADGLTRSRSNPPNPINGRGYKPAPSWAYTNNIGDHGGTGRSIVLTTQGVFYNGPDGNIQGGRGGNHYDSRAVGGDGGSVEIYGDEIVNEGNIGPGCDSDDPGSNGGHGGHSQTPAGYPDDDYADPWCNDAFGGNGGDTILLGDILLINMPIGRVSSGKGGDAKYGHCNGYPGQAGHLLFTAPTTIQNGNIQGCGKGSVVSCDPPNVYVKGKTSGDEVIFAGGHSSVIDLKELAAGGISASENIVIAVGDCGVVNLQGAVKDILNAGKRVDIYADNILKDDCVTLSEILGDANIHLHPSKIIYDFLLKIKKNPVKGTADRFAYIPMFILNNSPERDTYKIKVTDSLARELNVLDGDGNVLNNHEVTVPSFKHEIFCLKVRLPDEMDEHDRLVIEATSKGNPDLTRIASVTVYSQAPPPESPDSDGDGLTDFMEENNYGTQMDNPDSDGDGLTDGWEIHHELDPLVGSDAGEDPDNDGFTNFEEFEAATNPRDALSTPQAAGEYPPDKDRDGLPDVIEEKLGTQKDNPDSDNDGMEDAWEVYHELNPKDEADAHEDPDKDGFCNLHEFNAGTDPNDPESVPEVYWKDTDGDGLPDVIEKKYGTKSGVPESEDDIPDNTWDTDGDGLGDGWEVYNGLDPLVPEPDSDSDGLNNGWEMYLDLNPDEAEPDADGDGLADGWEDFYGFDSTLPNDPENEDSDDDGFSDLEEYEAMTDPTDPDANPDNPPVVYPQDSDHDGLPDVVEMAGEDEEQGMFGTDPDNPDSDGDGIKDGWEVYHGLDPAKKKDGHEDPDGDEFSNLEEYQARTNPDDADDKPNSHRPTDTDKDGLPDVVEAEHGTDLNNADEDADGMMDGWEFFNNVDDPDDDPDEDGSTNLEEYEARTDPNNTESKPQPYQPQDTDEDGLPDVVEAAYGTNKASADTDGDSLPDAWELCHGFNPSSESENEAEDDPDEDTFSNLVEFEAGSDPNDADSTPDTLPDPDDDDASDSTVPCPQDTDEDGLPDMAETNFFGTDPENPDSDNDGMTDAWEICHGLNPSSEVSENEADEDPDEDGFTNLEEFKAGSHPLDWESIPKAYQPKDSDNDGLPDKVEQEIYGTNPNKSDTDEDGIKDGWEIWHELDDASDDPDFDGFTNLEEFRAGSDPNNRNSIPEEFPKDSDGDGLPDVVEQVYGTCPIICEEADDEICPDICEDVDDPSDTDGDGMGDAWEVWHELNPLEDDAWNDPDGDGYTNIEEYQAWTEYKGWSAPGEPASVPNLAFKAGVFIVGEDGIVKMDWLYDGGLYSNGEFGVFSLTGMESLTKYEFIRKAIRRVLSSKNDLEDSRKACAQGCIVLSDREEGSRFKGVLDEEKGDWNHGAYLGTKELEMTPGDRIATIFIPNASFAEAAEDPFTDEEINRPLFSFISPNADYGMHLGQVADVTGMGEAFVYEDIDLRSPACDRDYNDFIIKITGATVNALPDLDSLMDVSDKSRKKRRDDRDWFDWRRETELGRLIMAHLDASEETMLSVEIDGDADLLIFDTQNRVIGREGGFLPGATFKHHDGQQIIHLPQLAEGPHDYRVVLRSATHKRIHLTVRTPDDEDGRTISVDIKAHQVLKADMSVSVFADETTYDLETPDVPRSPDGTLLPYDFDGDGDIDDKDIERISSAWNTCENEEGCELFYDLDDDGNITVLDIMTVSNSKTD